MGVASYQRTLAEGGRRERESRERWRQGKGEEFTEMGGNWEMGRRMKGERKSAYLGGREGVVENFQLSAYIWSERGGAEHLSLTYRAHSQHTTSNCNAILDHRQQFSHFCFCYFF